MLVENVAKAASKMYGLSLFKSQIMVEQVIHEYSDLNEGQILRMIGEKSLFYMASAAAK